MKSKGTVIMLGGVPRAGKTTLAVRLVKSGNNISKISGDYFGDAIGEENENTYTFVEKYLESLLRDAEVYGINSVFEYCLYDITLEHIEKLPFKDELEMYFFGFPDISAEEIKYNIKHYAAPEDWISYVDDDYLEQTANRIYDFNIKLKGWCKKYNYRFINTGVGEERNIVLNSLYDEIIKRCSI